MKLLRFSLSLMLFTVFLQGEAQDPAVIAKQIKQSAQQQTLFITLSTLISLAEVATIDSTNERAIRHTHLATFFSSIGSLPLTLGALNRLISTKNSVDLPPALMLFLLPHICREQLARQGKRESAAIGSYCEHLSVDMRKKIEQEVLNQLLFSLGILGIGAYHGKRIYTGKSIPLATFLFQVILYALKTHQLVSLQKLIRERALLWKEKQKQVSDSLEQYDKNDKIAADITPQAGSNSRSLEQRVRDAAEFIETLGLKQTAKKIN